MAAAYLRPLERARPTGSENRGEENSELHGPDLITSARQMRMPSLKFADLATHKKLSWALTPFKNPHIIVSLRQVSRIGGPQCCVYFAF